MSLPRYPAYRDSGVEWLGEVPAHWEVDRLKRSSVRCKNGVWGAEPDSDANDIACVRVADFDRQRLRVDLSDPTIRSVTPNEREGRLLRRGDLLLEKSGGGELQPVGCVVLYDDDAPAVCSNFVARVELAREMSPSFWRYQHAAAYAVRLNTRSIKQTSGIQNLDAQQYFDERCAFPPPGEQTQIAEFLELETAKIDALVAEQQRLIDLLKEKRQAVISHAVTKGLNPNAPMKDSGIEWLGEVPAHWQVKKFFRVLSEPPRNGISPEITRDGTTPTFSIAAVRNGRVDITSHLKLTTISSAMAEPFLVRQNDILVLRGSGSKELVGTAGIVDDPPPAGCIYPDILIRVRPDVQILSRFLLSAINSNALRVQLEQFAQTAAGIWKISGASLRQLLLAVPPRAEQDEIQRYLARQNSALDALSAEATRAIDFLTERRTALISAAVTGQIDVRRHPRSPTP